MKKKNHPIFKNVEITAAAAEGKAVARVDTRVIFIGNAVPGDIADIQITKKARRFFEGRAIKFHKYSDKRVEPRCIHFGVCGGCKWQHMDYHWQMQYKQQQVFDALTRIGKVEFPEMFPIIGSKEIYYYRNRLDFSFSNKKWLTVEEIGSGDEFADRNALGFHIPGTFDKVLDISECHLQGTLSEAIRQFVREFVRQKAYIFFDIKVQSGFLRTMTVRTASTGETMVIMQFYEDNEPARVELLDAMVNQFPQITSLIYFINPKDNLILHFFLITRLLISSQVVTSSGFFR